MKKKTDREDTLIHKKSTLRYHQKAYLEWLNDNVRLQYVNLKLEFFRKVEHTL